MSEFALGRTQSPYGIAAGPDGNLWFTGFNSITTARLKSTGEVAEFSIPTQDGAPHNIVASSDGAFWFTQTKADSVDRITVDGHTTEYVLPTAGSQPYGMAAANDGALSYSLLTGRALGKISSSGKISRVSIESVRSLNGIAISSDEVIWFAAPRSKAIGRLSPNSAPQSSI